MSFYVGNKPFNGFQWTPELDQMLWKELPEPEMANQTSEELDPDKTLNILQGEYAYVDTAKNPEVQGIATGNVADCLVVHIYNFAGEHCVIHHSHDRTIDYAELWPQFKDKRLLQVSLVGGMPGKEGVKRGLLAVGDLIASLARFVLQSKDKSLVKVVSQKVLNRNQLTEAHWPLRCTLVVERILQKISLTYFNRKPEIKFDYANPKLNFNLPNVANYDRNLIYLATRQIECFQRDYPQFSQEQFHQLVRMLKTQQAFEHLIRLEVELLKLNDTPFFEDLVINLKTRRIVPIVFPMRVPGQTVRDAALLQKALDPSGSPDYVRIAPGPQPFTSLHFNTRFLGACQEQVKQLEQHRLIYPLPLPNKPLLTAFGYQKYASNPLTVKMLENRLIRILEYYKGHPEEFQNKKLTP